MSGAVATRRQSPVGNILQLQGFERLAAELKEWRKSDDLKIIQAARGSALVLPFVKGLRLSAQLIYILRVQLSGTSLEVDWGHLLNREKESCSPECDIIIHRKGCYQEWDGNDHPIMHFKFVESKHAIAVVSCKSYAKDVDAGYARKLRPYVKHVFLFAECCAPNKIQSLQQKARNAGYAGFWYLYTYNETAGSTDNDPKNWRAFLQTVKSKVGRGIKKK